MVDSDDLVGNGVRQRFAAQKAPPDGLQGGRESEFRGLLLEPTGTDGLVRPAPYF